MKEPLISVLIPSYNHAKYIAECINSIVNQSYKNIELIIVDDNSNECNKVSTFINDDIFKCLNVKLITINKDEKTWVNPCIPYNMGFKVATGDIIVIQNPEVMQQNLWSAEALACHRTCSAKIALRTQCAQRTEEYGGSCALRKAEPA